MSAAVIELLAGRSGLQLDDDRLGLERALARRQAAVGLAPPAYLELLRSDVAELDTLTELLLIPETWFFRHERAFELVSEAVRRSEGRRTVQLFCLPCSTGEEAWSLAMAALDAGLPKERVQVTAVDLSRASLARARAGGPYRENAFRTSELSFRRRYMRQDNEGWWVNDSLKPLVQFRQGNALAGPPAAPGGYDIIFCRNLLIYLHDSARDQLVRRLESALAPDGLLFTTSAESPGFRRHMSPAIPGEPYVWRRSPPASSRPPAPTPRVARALRLRRPTAKRVKAHRSAARAVSEAPQAHTLAAAQRLADAGQLTEAQTICQRLLDAGPAPEALYLMGVVLGARGDLDGARRHLRQVVYLEPDHAEALEHLAALALREGDAAGSEALHRRAARARDRRERS